jgi:protein-S-isoprenylcysteine O-methyltransferase Ste14
MGELLARKRLARKNRFNLRAMTVKMLEAAIRRGDEHAFAKSKSMLASSWTRFRATKFFDLLAASPLIAWCWLGLHNLFPLLVHRAHELSAGSIGLNHLLQFAAVVGSASFNLAAIVLLTIRTKPLLRSKGILPRLTGFAGSFFGASLFFLPAVDLSLPLQAISNILIFGGCGGALFVLFWLGRGFAMLPEARRLDVSGPYALVRHPLYVCETIAFLGLVLQFQQPWALGIMLVGSILMAARSMFEERVLEEQFPDYAAYRFRTARFVPGIY